MPSPSTSAPSPEGRPLRRAAAAAGWLLLLLRGLWDLLRALAAVVRVSTAVGSQAPEPAVAPAPPPPRASGVVSAAATRPAGAPAGCAAPGEGGAPAVFVSASPARSAASPGAGPPELLDDDGFLLSAAAAANPFSPPATARHAAFLKLVDSSIRAGLHARYMRDADFSALAAEAGAPLFGDDSLIVAYLRASQSRALWGQAVVESSNAEAALLERRSWVVLLAQALPVLQQRLDAGTLLPGRGVRPTERAYFVYVELLVGRETASEDTPDVALLRLASPVFGLETAFFAAGTALNLLPVHRQWRGDQRERAQGFVLAALRLIPKTAGMRIRVPSEHDLVDRMERCMTPACYGAEFCATALALWRSPAVADVLRSRGTLQEGVAAFAAAEARFDARKQTDVAKRGLWRCALPSCGKLETTVLQFRVCSHCQRIRYCCAEHAKAHWPAHKRESDE